MDHFSVDIESITDQVFESLRGLNIDPLGSIRIEKGTSCMCGSSSEVQEKSFDVTPGARLFVHGHGGAVAVRASDELVIRIHATGVDEDEHGFEEPLQCTVNDNQVTVRSDTSASALDADLSIQVPHGCAVWVHTVDGDVSIVGTRGEIEADTVSGGVAVVDGVTSCRLNSVDGDIQVDGVSGDSHLTTVSGDIVARRLDGNLFVQTADGDTRISESRLTSFTAHATNGDLLADTPLVSGGQYQIHTADGDVTLKVPPGTGATVTLHTVSGDLRSDLPATNVERDRHHWRGVIGDGSANVEMHSVHGTLTIRQGERTPGDMRPSESWFSDTDPIPPVPPIPPIQPISPVPAVPPMPPSESSMRFENEPDTEHDSGDRDSTIAVLAELERGNLTVEEALARLDQA